MMQQAARIPPGLILPENFARRTTLTETLNRLRQRPDELWEVIESLAKESKDFLGFRKHSARVQSDQDRYLQCYYDFIADCNRKSRDDFTEEELDKEAFPFNDHVKLFENLRRFLIVYYRFAQPRSAAQGTHISWSSLTKVREAMQFWVQYKRRLGNAPAISNADLYQRMCEVMRAVMAKYRISDVQTTRKKHPKQHLGLAELRELFDYEMTHNSGIEYSEQHQAVWCIARLTACRPGSICWSGPGSNHDALKWHNLDFEVDGGPGKFKLTIRFNSLRIKASLDPANHSVHDTGNDSANVILRPPNTQNLIFSAAHRLLVIALRRNILQDIENLGELMAWDKRSITIKSAHQDDYLFYTGNPKGMGLNTRAPLSVSALNGYLKTRCWKIGYTINTLGMMAIRRRAATDLMSRIGADATRRILGHMPGTHTLEKYYLFMGPTMDQTGALLEQEIGPQAYSTLYGSLWAPLVMGKIDQEAVTRTRDSALRSVVDRLALEDSDPPAITTVDERRTYRKRLRLHAHRALLEHEKQQANQAMTQEKWTHRQQGLDASHFAKVVLDRALHLQAQSAGVEDNSDLSTITTNNDDADDDDDDENDDRIHDDVPEPDIEDSLAKGSTLTLAIEEEPSRGSNAKTEHHYAMYATAFMETLYDNSMTKFQTWVEGDTTCPECQVDETTTDEHKVRQWDSAQHLEAHLSSNFHGPLECFRRTARKVFDENGMFLCPYCEQTSGGEKTPAWTILSSLERHIKRSTALNTNARHDELKIIDGWYDINFFLKALEATKVKAHQHGRKNLGRLGMKVKDYKQPGDGRPLATPGVYTGGLGPEEWKGYMKEKLAGLTIPTPASGVLGADLRERFSAAIIPKQLDGPNVYGPEWEALTRERVKHWLPSTTMAQEDRVVPTKRQKVANIDNDSGKIGNKAMGSPHRSISSNDSSE